jgi:hypothetical protein
VLVSPTLAVALSVGLMTSTSGQGNQAGTNGFEVGLTTGKPAYRPGEPITISLRVTTRGSEDVRLQFGSSQRYDFVIRDAGGTPVWRWSEGQAFLQVLGVERLGPGRPSITYQAEYGGHLAPGWYSVEGTVVAKNRPLSATIAIQVQ